MAGTEKGFIMKNKFLINIIVLFVAVFLILSSCSGTIFDSREKDSGTLILPPQSAYERASAKAGMTALIINDDNDIHFDDDQSIERFNTIIQNMGYTTTTEDSSATNNATWINYDFIVWSDGDDVTPLATASYRDAMEDYVNNGGCLIIEGGHIARYVPADSFMSTVLHATTDFVYSDVGDMTFKTSHPVATNPNALPATIGFTATNPGDTSGDADAVRCLSDAVGVYGWFDVRWGGSSAIPSVIEACNSIIAYDDDEDVSNGGQIVYFTIDIDDIDSTTTQEQLISNSVTWITATPSENDVGIESIDTPIDGENYALGIHEINATVLNYGTNAQSGFDVSCEIKELDPGYTNKIFDDNTEGGVGGWTHADLATGGDLWHITNYGHINATSWFCGNDGANYNADMDNVLTSQNINLPEATGNMFFSFWTDYDLEGSSFDNLYVEIYDGTWYELEHYPQSTGDVSGGWVYKEYDISTYAGKTVKIRFRMVTDGSVNYGGGTSDPPEGVFIDDIMIREVIASIETTVFGPSTKTVTTTLSQYDTETMTWDYTFENTSAYKIFVKTLLLGDTKWSNDEKSITITIISSAFAFSLQEGWNFITLPLNTTYERAEDLANAISSCTHISKWNISTSSFVSHQKGTDVNNFTIDDGVGYIVYVEGDAVFEVNGIEILPVTMSLQKGWNSIGWFNETSTDAESLAQDITNCTTISYWNNTLGRFVMHPVGTNISNFVVEKGNGYLVYVTSETTWTQ